MNFQRKPWSFHVKIQVCYHGGDFLGHGRLPIASTKPRKHGIFVKQNMGTLQTIGMQTANTMVSILIPTT